MAPGYLFKPPGAGQRVTSLLPPDPQSASHVGYLRLNHLSPWAGSAGWPNWELPFVQWAEREGYDFDVVTNADLEEHPELLGEDSPCRLYLSIGHDEYWSAPMRDTVEAFIARGGNAAFLSGNTSFWQVRMEDQTGASGDGPATTMVGYKGMFKRDPVFGTDRQAELTTIWSDHLLERPENHMTGVSFTRGGYHRIGKRVTNGASGYTLHRAEHWIFDGTGLGYGDVLGAAASVVGYECDGCDFTMRDGLPYPTGSDGTPENFEILGSAPAAHFTRTTASRPPAPHEPAEDEFIASRVFDTPRPRGDRTDLARSRHPRHVRVRRWRHRDHLGIDRLGLGACRARSPRGTDHPEHLRPTRLRRRGEFVRAPSVTPERRSAARGEREQVGDDRLKAGRVRREFCAVRVDHDHAPVDDRGAGTLRRAEDRIDTGDDERFAAAHGNAHDGRAGVHLCGQEGLEAGEGLVECETVELAVEIRGGRLGRDADTVEPGRVREDARSCRRRR